MSMNGSAPEIFRDPKETRAALRAMSRAAAFYLYNRRVSLIDIGFQIKDNKITSVPAVRVHVRYKPHGAAFETFAEQHPEELIDKSQIDYPVDIIEAKYQLHWHVLRPVKKPLRGQYFNPLSGGISISNEWDYNFGTLGGKVRDRLTGDDMLLSASHVLSGFYRKSELRIYQPGTADGGKHLHTIAWLIRDVMDKGIDAAVARLAGNRPIVNDQIGLGPVLGVMEPVLGSRVIKSGRASGITEGIVTGLEGIITIPYRGFRRIIRHLVHIAQTPERGQVSTGGDSGSWWLEKETKKAVGLHIAGSDLPEYGLAIAMPEVLDALNVDIITEL